MVIDRKLRGSSGEHLVCGVLAQFNWAAALTREGVARTDVLAVNADTGKTVTIQVKTTWREKKLKTDRPVGWRLGMKDILPAAAPTEWYVMVKLEKGTHRPRPAISSCRGTTSRRRRGSCTATGRPTPR